MASLFVPSAGHKMQNLLVKYARQILKDNFDSIHSPSNLHAVLGDPEVKKKLKRLQANHVLYGKQMGILYPGVAPADPSADFDIALLIILLKNICNLTAPATGWSKPPSPTDESIEADLVRVNLCRNKFSHCTSFALTATEFEDDWAEMEKVLNRLGNDRYKEDIQNLKIETIDPENYTEKDYDDLLKSREEEEEKRYEEQQNLKMEVKDLRQKLDEIDNKVSAEINIRSVFKLASAGVVVVGWAAGCTYFLDKYKDDPEKVKSVVQGAIFSGTLMGATVTAIMRGSIIIKVEVTSLQALEYIRKSSIEGELKDKLQKVIVTDELLQLAPPGTEKVDISVSISEEEYNNARDCLMGGSWKNIRKRPHQNDERDSGYNTAFGDDYADPPRKKARKNFFEDHSSPSVCHGAEKSSKRNGRVTGSHDLATKAPKRQAILFYDELNKIEDLANILTSLSEEYQQELANQGYFQHLVEKSFANMNVRGGMVCEDRSLEVLECKTQDPTLHETFPGTNEVDASGFQALTRCIYHEENEDEDKPLEMLYSILVSPVQNHLTQDEIVIIPDGPLFMVPFAALQGPETGKFLSETKRIRLAPSLTTFKLLQESLYDYHYKSGALIVGNPATGTVMYRGKKRMITALYGAEDEAKRIGDLLGVKPLIGKQAAKQTILRKLQDGVSVIHFAARRSRENGQIIVAPSVPSTTDNIPKEEDYILTMKEVQESGIRAELVVLSCCHSGRGDIKSEGVVGMARAFLAAGARAVVASLWAIADAPTMEFMPKFYSHLKKGESASKSLQETMKEMRETEKYNKPKYWAPFFLIGDDVTISV